MNTTNGGEDEHLAPVTPIFGGRSAPVRSLHDARGRMEEGAGSPSPQHPAGGAYGARHVSPKDEMRTRLRALQTHEQPPRGVASDAFSERDDSLSVDPVLVREKAEAVLVRRLRARALSIAEARTVLRDAALDGDQIDDVITEFCRRGYLDDAVLAEHLVRSGSERKGMGRVALARALSGRGLPRDVVDAALQELPDDDAERALSYARTKAPALSRLDGDTALRRLVGQLARRGYGGGVAMTAARRALDEAQRGSRTSGVRFVESD